jgi:CHAT domain-containing protein/tetratricopeptide (TPR) repeat protein
MFARALRGEPLRNRVLNSSAFLICVVLVLLIGCGPPDVNTILAKNPKFKNLSQDIHMGNLAQANRFQQLLSYLEQKRHQVGNSRLRAWDHYWLCQSYYALKVYNKLLPEIDRMAEKITAGDNSYFGSDLTVEPHILRAKVYLDLGDYDQCIGEADRAFTLLHQQNRQKQALYRAQLIGILGTRGVALVLTGQPGKARRDVALINAVDLRKSNLGPEKYMALARIHMAEKDFALALAAVRNPQSGVGPTLSQHYDTTFQEVPKRFIMSKSLFETGNTAAAKNGYDQLLKHPHIQEQGGIYWLILYDRARIAVSEGQIGPAIDLLETAVNVIEQQRASIDTDTGRIGFVGDKQNVYRKLIALLIDQKKYAAAFQYVERSKARALVDLLASQRQFSSKSDDPTQAISMMNELGNAEAFLLPSGREDDLVLRSRYRGLVVDCKKDLETKSPELASLITVSSPAPEELQQHLPPHETLLEYYYDNHRTYIFVVTRSQIRCQTSPRPGLEKDIHYLLETILQPESNAFITYSRKLYDRLIKPVAADLGHRHLTIVPHGMMHYLPFNALNSGSCFIVEKYSIRLLPSAGVLIFLGDREAGKVKNLLAIGNPALGDPKYNLKFAQQEAMSIRGVVPGTTLVLRDQATETVVKEQGSRFKRLHFACHGVFDADKPLNSALLLAKDPLNDGRLTVGELYNLRLNADLVTLSACNTGLGKIASGDDVVGLTRGMLYAGASTIVASLWPVDDLATRDLMVEFYKNLSHFNKRESLRNAQLAVKRQYTHPFYWAPFQLTGNSDASAELKTQPSERQAALNRNRPVSITNTRWLAPETDDGRINGYWFKEGGTLGCMSWKRGFSKFDPNVWTFGNWQMKHNQWVQVGKSVYVSVNDRSFQMWCTVKGDEMECEVLPLTGERYRTILSQRKGA